MITPKMWMETMLNKSLLIIVLLFSLCQFPLAAEESSLTLDNPISVQYLEDNLLKTQPRLVLNPENAGLLREKLETDPVVKNMYAAIKLAALEVMEQPPATRIMTGRRLLSVSRRVLYRINMLGMVYVVEQDDKVLQRIDAELKAVCTFSDWNPSHFLDTAEMSLAVALALDWTAGALPQSTIDLATTALIEKGIQPSFDRKHSWINGTNNWNQVCHGGMIAAAIAIAEIDPELAAKTISRALDGMPSALHEYGPDGVYPEGSTYWGYGTAFSVMTSAMLSSAFATDFGLADYPGFQQSAVFRTLMNAPSGLYYNYGDCGDQRNRNGDVILAWFAAQTGNSAFYEKDRFLLPPEEMNELSRFAGAALVWLSHYEEKESQRIPTVWVGNGLTPVAIIKDEADPHHYYFGAKGGQPTDSHAAMDNGSFVFELNGVRWAIEMGNQSYHALEKTGFNLWGRTQDSDRWTLLTKNNFGHSTITVNDQPHVVSGRATLVDAKLAENPQFTFDISSSFVGLLKSAKRTFIKDTPTSLVIEDDIVLSDSTELITWQMMTTADVDIVDGGVILKQDGKSLKLANLSHPELMLSVISLDPPPLELDRRIKNLKRIEIRIPTWTVDGGKAKIRVRLVGE
jgi:hypothetical protein